MSAFELKACPFCGGEAESVSCVDAWLVQCQDCLATAAGHDEENAIAQWNWRTPAPMTSVVTWVRYNGTPETLPEDDEHVLLYRIKKQYRFPDVARCIRHEEYPWKWGMQSGFIGIMVGDVWFRISTPAEGDA